MQSRWKDADARRAISVYGALGAGEELALRAYTTRLLGRRAGAGAAWRRQYLAEDRDGRLAGETHEVLCVKGSGWDMGDDRPVGLAGRQARAAARSCARCDDSERRGHGARPARQSHRSAGARTPRWRSLLHAFMPHKFVDHTHANAVLALIDQPDGAGAGARGLRQRAWASCPTPCPGFGLGQDGRAMCSTPIPTVEGLILDKHGIFTFGATRARGLRAHDRDGDAGRGAPAARRARRCSRRGAADGDRAAGRGGADPARRLQLGRREDRRRVAAGWCWSSAAAMPFAISSTARSSARYARAGRGDAGPRHPHQELAADRAGAGGRQARRLQGARARRASQASSPATQAYFERNIARLEPTARSCSIRCRASSWCRGSACSASAAARGRARSPPTSPRPPSPSSPTPRRSASSSRSASSTCSSANTGRSEQAKLGAGDGAAAGRRRSPSSPAAAAAIGAATARAFAAAGAEVGAARRRRGRGAGKAQAIGGSALAVACDVTDAASVRARLRPGGGGLRRRRHRRVERRRRLAGPHRRGRRGGAARRASSSISTATSAWRRTRCASCWRRAPAAACCSTCPSRR